MSGTTESYRGASERSRPFGIYVVVVLGGLGSIFAIIRNPGLVGVVENPLLGLGLAVGAIGLNVFRLLVLYMLYRLDPWGWKWFLVIEPVRIVTVYAEMAAFNEGVDPLLVLGTFVSAAFVVYVYAMREHFGEGETYPRPAVRSRPLGIYLVVGFGVLGCLFGVIESFGLLGVVENPLLGVGLVMGGLAVTTFRLFVFCMLYRLEPWGWKWFLLFEPVSIGAIYAEMAAFDEGVDPLLVLGTFVSAAFVVYVYATREQFQERGYPG